MSEKLATDNDIIKSLFEYEKQDQAKLKKNKKQLENKIEGIKKQLKEDYLSPRGEKNVKLWLEIYEEELIETNNNIL